MSAHLHKFLKEKMSLKLREFRSFGGSVNWQNNLLVITAPSVPIFNQFENDVLGKIHEHYIALTSENWNKLMLMCPNKNSLFKQLVDSFSGNDVFIMLEISSLMVVVVGLKESVQNVISAFDAELNKEIIVEQ